MCIAICLLWFFLTLVCCSSESGKPRNVFATLSRLWCKVVDWIVETVTNCTDDLTLPGSTDILDPVDYGNKFALDADTVRIAT